jgi:hypothetical protein
MNRLHRLSHYPTRSALSESRSVSSLSLAEKASKVFLALYFLRSKRLSIKPCVRLLRG